jgi:hypothetical protein
MSSHPEMQALAKSIPTSLVNDIKLDHNFPWFNKFNIPKVRQKRCHTHLTPGPKGPMVNWFCVMTSGDDRICPNARGIRKKASTKLLPLLDGYLSLIAKK